VHGPPTVCPPRHACGRHALCKMSWPLREITFANSDLILWSENFAFKPHWCKQYINQVVITYIWTSIYGIVFMCVDCVLASSRIAQVDPGDEPLSEVVPSQICTEHPEPSINYRLILGVDFKTIYFRNFIPRPLKVWDILFQPLFSYELRISRTLLQFYI
jgi:hypothetical protein